MSEVKKPLELEMKFACLGDVWCWEFEDSFGDDSHIRDDETIMFVEKTAYDKAVQALKLAQKELSRLNMDAPLNLSIETGTILLTVNRTLKELGEI